MAQSGSKCERQQEEKVFHFSQDLGAGRKTKKSVEKYLVEKPRRLHSFAPQKADLWK